MSNLRLELFAVPGIPKIKAGDDLVQIIADSIDAASLKLADGDVVVVAQKIVSKAEARSVCLKDVSPGAEAIELAAEADKDPAIVQLILNESRRIVRHRPGVIIAEHKSGWVLANAGIDRSNVTVDGDEVLLLYHLSPINRPAFVVEVFYQRLR